MADAAGDDGDDTSASDGPDTTPSVRATPTATDSADHAMIQRARQRHGAAGAIVAGGMLGLEKVLGRPAKEEIPVVWEADGEPMDIDSDGITVAVDEERNVHAHPGAPTGGTGRRVVKRRR